VRLIPEAADAARRLGNAGHALVLISNQAAFVKGKTTLRQLWLVHERFVALLADNEVRLDAIFYAYGHPEGVVPHFSGPSLDRKPAPYNVFIAFMARGRSGYRHALRRGGGLAGDHGCEPAP
jgi:D-glycero-D-manno-heptose 1,7-bisphosphate phosphatase